MLGKIRTKNLKKKSNFHRPIEEFQGAHGDKICVSYADDQIPAFEHISHTYIEYVAVPQ